MSDAPVIEGEAVEMEMRKDRYRRLTEMGPDLARRWVFPIDEKLEKLFDEYDDAKELDDLVGMLKAQIKILELL